MVNLIFCDLSFVGNMLEDDSVEILVEYFKVNKVLVCLNLGVNGIIDYGVIFLVESLCCNILLEVLVLVGNLSFGNFGVLFFCEIFKINNMFVKLDLLGSSLDDDGVQLFFKIVRDGIILIDLNLLDMKMIIKKSICFFVEFLRVDLFLILFGFKGNKVSVGGV